MYLSSVICNDTIWKVLVLLPKHSSWRKDWRSCCLGWPLRHLPTVYINKIFYFFLALALVTIVKTFARSLSVSLSLSISVKRKRFIRKSRRAVTESRHSYQLLSRLIGEDLAELASDWLAALRDFALINLPDELAFQRPSTAGAFYDTQTGIEQVRPFYARSWLALLEAATLCLNTEAKCTSKLSHSDHVATERLTVVPMTRDSFFLIFGKLFFTIQPTRKFISRLIWHGEVENWQLRWYKARIVCTIRYVMGSDCAY